MVDLLTAPMLKVKVKGRGASHEMSNSLTNFISFLSAANSQLQIPPNVTCACPNDVLTFTCTAVSTGATIWGGSAFQCPTREIILRHNAFGGQTPTSGDCNGIIGESVRVQDNNCYISQLRVPINAGLDNKTVHCIYNSDTMTLIGEAQVSVVTGRLISNTCN